MAAIQVRQQPILPFRVDRSGGVSVGWATGPSDSETVRSSGRGLPSRIVDKKK